MCTTKPSGVYGSEDGAMPTEKTCQIAAYFLTLAAIEDNKDGNIVNPTPAMLCTGRDADLLSRNFC